MTQYKTDKIKLIQYLVKKNEVYSGAGNKYTCKWSDIVGEWLIECICHYCDILFNDCASECICQQNEKE